LELYYAERGRELAGSFVREAARETETAPAAVAAGRMTTAGAIAARVALETARDRLLERERDVAMAQGALLVRPDVPAAKVRQARQVAFHGHAARAEVCG